MAWPAAGIDFGNKFSVVSIVQGNVVRVVSNESASRITPSSVTYSNQRRYAGEASQQQRLRHPQSTLTGLKQLCGLQYGSSAQRELAGSVPYKMVALENGITGVAVHYHDSELVLTSEQVLASLLKELRKVAQISNQATDRYIISVPRWWEEGQRRALLETAKIAGVHCMGLLNDTTAAAIAYESEWRTRLNGDSAKNVMFVDAGDLTISVAIARIRPCSVDIVASDSDGGVSGRSFTGLLYDHIMKAVEARCRFSRSELSPRQRQRFEDAVEVTKKNLSVNAVVQFECVGLPGDRDVVLPVRREEFINLISGPVENAVRMVDHVIKNSKIAIKNISALEFVGGGSRIPYLRQKIAEFMGREANSSMNADEAVSVGCCHFAVAMNTKARQRVMVRDVIGTAISLRTSGASSVLFAPGTLFPVTVARLTEAGTSDLIVGSQVVGTCEVQGSRKVQVTFSINASGLLNAQGVGVVWSPRITDNTELFIEMEHQMTEADQADEYIDLLRNELDGQMFEFEAALTRDCSQYFSPQESADANALVARLQTWLSDVEDGGATASEYQTAMKDVSSRLASVKRRRTVFTDVRDNGPSIISRAQSEIDRISRINPRAPAISHLRRAVDDIRNLMAMPCYQDTGLDLTKIAAYISETARTVK